MPHLRGEAYACCSCSVGCPCAAGGSETTGSDGCCAVQILEVHEGEVDGTDLAGARLAAAVDWPGAMMAGNGRGRLYFDAGTTLAQRSVLEAVVRGRLGGSFASIPELVPTFLPPILVAIETRRHEGVTVVRAGDYGEAVLRPLASPARLNGSGGFRDDVALAAGTGSWWRDPDLRSWKGGGYAEHSDIEWRG